MQVSVKHWGRERVIEDNGHYVVTILEIDVNKNLSFQSEERQYTTMYCLYGYGDIHVIASGSKRELSFLPGRNITIAPGETYDIATGPMSSFVLLVVSSHVN